VFLFFCIDYSVDAVLNSHNGSYGAVDGFQVVRTVLRGLFGVVVP
jgi:hypothetical protein